MSVLLLEFAKSFLEERLPASVFSDAYLELWKIERDKGLLLEDTPALSECLSSIFCAADMYCSKDELRKDYEFNDEKLKSEVYKLLSILKSNEYPS